MSHLWEGDDALIMQYVASKFPHVEGFSPGSRALGWVDGQSLVGGVVLSPRGGGFDAELSIALEPQCRVMPGHIKTLFHVAFSVFGLKRITCHIAKGNKPARAFVKRLGFREEGLMRKGYDGKQTAMLYGMTADECRWL